MTHLTFTPGWACRRAPRSANNSGESSGCGRPRLHPAGPPPPPARPGAGGRHRCRENSFPHKDSPALQKARTVSQDTIRAWALDSAAHRRHSHSEAGGLSHWDVDYVSPVLCGFRWGWKRAVVLVAVAWFELLLLLPPPHVMTSRVRYSSIPRDHDRSFFTRLGIVTVSVVDPE